MCAKGATALAACSLQCIHDVAYMFGINNFKEFKSWCLRNDESLSLKFCAQSREGGLYDISLARIVNFDLIFFGSKLPKFLCGNIMNPASMNSMILFESLRTQTC